MERERSSTRASAPGRTHRARLLAITLVAAALGAQVAGAQEIPGPISRPCQHPCLNQIIFRDAPRLDTWILHARIIPMSDIDPANEDVTIEISNANDTIFASTLPAGEIRGTANGRKFTFTDPTARVLGGIQRLTITKRNDANDGYRVDAVVHEDLSLATLAEMTTRISIGGDSFNHTDVWLTRNYGWAVDFPP